MCCVLYWRNFRLEYVSPLYVLKGNKEHSCGWKKSRNCHKEVQIHEHECFMQWERQKGGICQTKSGVQFCSP